jgi:shikimate kinase
MDLSILSKNVKICQNLSKNVKRKKERRMKAIAFIGMPGSGKTTVAAAVAKSLGLPFIDTDARIESYFKMSISDIFSTFGEAHFRVTESEIITDLVTVENVVISLGGGAVLQNEDVIAQNCLTVYLQRTIDNIFLTLQNQPNLRPLA